MTDHDFEVALDNGDYWFMRDPPNEESTARAQALYTKALAIATWRAAGRVQLIESSVLEHAEQPGHLSD